MKTARGRTALTAIALIVGAPVAALVYVAAFGDSRLDRAIPAIVGLGGVFGALNALVTVGIILIYRSQRVINFAQAGFGIAGLMLYLLVRSEWGWNFWLAVLFAVGVIAALAFVVEVFIVRRFAAAPRLVLTVVTIALAQTLAGITLTMPRMFGLVPPEGETESLSYLPSEPPGSPFDRFHVEWFPVRLTGDHIAAVVVMILAMIALTVFLQRSRVGKAVRAAAENGSRAETLGINVSTLSVTVWVLAAVLAAIAAIITGAVVRTSVAAAAGQGGAAVGGGLAAAVGATTLVRSLAAAVIARMEDVPLAVAAAIAIGMFEQGVLWANPSSSVVDVLLTVVIIGALLGQRSRRTRTEPASTWAASKEIRGIPAELASLPQVRAGVRRTLWLGAGLVVAWPWVMSPTQTNLGGIYAIYGILGISLVILTGWGGQVSLGQFGFAAVGAVTGGWATATVGLPFPVGLAVGSLAAAAVAAVVGLPALRIQGLFLAATTLSFAVAVSTWFVRLSWVPTRVTRPSFLGIDANTDERTYYYICVAGLALAIYVAQGLRRSRWGRLLIAMRDNERAAQAFGVNLMRNRLTAFALSGLLAGFAGALYVHHQSGVTAAAFGPQQSIQIFLMAVIGGLGSVYAVLVGALYLGTVTIVVTDGPLQLLSSSFGVLLILLFFPAGLGAAAFRVRDGWLRRIALRNRIFSPTLLGDRLRQGEEARVLLGARVGDDVEPVPVEYRLESSIGEQGRSQLAKLWRY